MKSENRKLSRPARWVLKRLIPTKDTELLEDSLTELYLGIRENRGAAAAGIWICLEIIKSLPGIITAGLYWRYWMLKNYILVALRNIKRHRIHTMINIVGLSLGMMFSLFIFLWIQDEVRYDRFHLHKHEIAQVFSEQRFDQGGSRIFMGSYYPLAELVKAECPEVIESVRISSATGLPVKSEGKTFTNDVIYLADHAFLEIFSFPLRRGDPAHALSDLQSIVITKKMAQKYFGNLDPIGKTLNLLGSVDLKVTGVLDDIPPQSSLRFDCVIPFLWNFDDLKEPAHWGGNPLETYVLLHDHADFDAVARKITTIVEKNRPQTSAIEHFHLHPLTRKHLYSPQGNSLIRSILIYSAAALLVLVIACINFMNLSTARAATRSREIGMRKVLGGVRSDLIRQFLGESLILSFISLGCAVAVIIPTLTIFNRLLDKQFTPNDLLQPAVLFAFLGTAVITGLLAGGYPAFTLSRMRPVSALGSRNAGGKQRSSLRKALVITQFSASTTLIVCLLVFSRQMRFMQRKDLGFERSRLVTLQVFPEAGQRYDALKTELLKYPSVSHVTRCLQHPVNISSTVSALEWEGKDPQKKYSMNWDMVGFDYFQTLGLDFVEGRGFSIEHPADLDGAYVINERARELMGWETAVGRRLSVFRNEGRIIGVVRDFHFRPLYQQIEPFVFILKPNSGSTILLRLQSEYAPSTLQQIEVTCKTVIPNASVTTVFFNDILDTHIYAAEKRMATLIGYFAAVAVLISCLGLFGLAAFMAQQKTKEIGIRKVMGASVSGVVVMLSRDFMRWVLTANLISWPAAYFILRKMLSRFAYRIPIGSGAFLLASFAVLIIALAAVSFQTAAAARSNPVDSLRFE